MLTKLNTQTTIMDLLFVDCHLQFRGLIGVHNCCGFLNINWYSLFDFPGLIVQIISWMLLSDYCDRLKNIYMDSHWVFYKLMREFIQSSFVSKLAREKLSTAK